MRIKLRWAALTTGLVMGLIGCILWRTLSEGSAHIATRKVLFYQDSMHPWIKSDSPGKCTLCSMDLTAIYEGQKGFGASDDIVLLSTNSITVLNVQTEEVKRQILHRTVRVAGTLEPNESRKTILSAPAAGRVLTLAVESVGMEVAEKQKLLTFYSPDWALKRQNAFRFRVDIQPNAGSTPKPEIDAFSIDLTAPQAGTVVERNVYNGQYVLEGDKLLTIIDSSVLWFRFDAYENQLPLLDVGQSVRVTVPAVPDRVFAAKIALIEPVLDATTRTVKVRADIQNPMVEASGKKMWLLHYGMYAEGQVRSDPTEVLAVPRSAILFPGATAYAYVDNGAGAYERRRVRLGRQGDGFFEVLSGLDIGDRVVTSGNVLIDAQAQFNQEKDDENVAADAKTDEASQETETAHAAVSMDMNQNRLPKAQPIGSPEPFTNSLARTTSSTNDYLFGEVFRPGQKERLALSRASLEGEVGKPLKEGTAVTDAIARNTLEGQMELDAALNGFLAEANALSQSLAADATPQFNQLTRNISNKVAVLENSFPAGHPFNPLIQKLVVQFMPTENLEEARTQFLPFSSAVVEFARAVKKDNPAFSGLKIYYCPMAPKPGLWMQLQGPLRNPFFGSQMLTCGKEVQ